MKTKLFSILVVSGFLGTLAACGSPSVSDSLDDAISAQCSKAFECMSSFPSDQGSFEDSYTSSESTCVSTFEGLSAQYKSQLQASVDAGRVTYNADDAQDCIDAESGASCGQFWGTEPFTPPASCGTAFQGTVADGGACTIDDDCASGSSECDPSTMTCTPEG